MMRARRGSALILVLMMTLAVAGLSIAAIFMSSSAGLLSAFYDRERDYRLAADAALEVARTRLRRDSTLVVPDTGMRVLLSGYQVRDAQGVVLPRVRVNVYAAVTGDTTGAFLPFITLVAQAYDAGGTRHVRRVDLRQESFSRYGLFVDSFPGSLTHGPAAAPGRVHTNSTWRSSGSGNTYEDTVTAVGGLTGTATFRSDTVVGGPRVRFPRDSTFPALHALAAGANLAFTPLTGAAQGTRIEFVAFDANNDGTVGPAEGFARVFDLSNVAGVDTSRLKATPVVHDAFFGVVQYYRWNDPVIQRQCGAFYRRGTRWHFFPISTHRLGWARAVIQQTGASDYPAVSAATMNVMDDTSMTAVELIMRNQATARCFPAGSPYLMTSERMTNLAGIITGTIADSIPFGVVTPPGGWPLSAPTGYGGSDTTFTVRSRTCAVWLLSALGRCDPGTLSDLGSWRAYGGTPVAGVATSVRQTPELPYLWPYTTQHNPASRGVISSTAGPLFVSGEIRGRVTLRVAGAVKVIDRIKYVRDPNDPLQPACDDQFGLVASQDVLVVEGLTSRVRRLAKPNAVLPWLLLDSAFTTAAGGARRFTLHGSYLSTGGTVGVENPGTTMGAAADQLLCPDDGAGTASNGGCLAITGSAAMRTYSALYGGTSNSGFRYYGIVDRCQSTTRRPPFFPTTNRSTFVRALEVDPTLANTPSRIRSLLMRLKGKAL